MSLQAGAIVGNNVRLLKPLKRGGMGSVWLAEHLTLHTQVAVKFMSERLAQDPEYVQRFSREAMSSAQIKSPHVVQVFDHGLVQDGTPFIVMELLEGEDLRVRLSRVGTISLEEAAVVVVHLARALSKAHALGIVHRDIKPDNVFLTDQDGELFVKVLDFGIAKHAAGSSDALDGMTGTGAMVGTPHYMSPEQILSARRVDHRADLWSVGVVLYRALTGQVPFQGETLGAVCIAIERGTFVPPSQRRPGVPPTLDAWFQRALARDPAHRFQSAKELADGFVAALGVGGSQIAQAPFRTESTSMRVPVPGGLGMSPTPPPGGGAVAPWAAATPAPLVGTNPADGAAMGKSGASASFVEPPWSSSGTGHSQPQMHTFHGSSVTQAEWKSSSRRAMVTVVSAVLGVVVIIAIGVAIIVKGGSEASSEKASAATAPSDVPVAPSSIAAAPPSPTAATIPAATTSDVASPRASASASGPEASGGAAKSTTTTATTTTTTSKPSTTSTGRPKRDRGF